MAIGPVILTVSLLQTNSIFGGFDDPLFQVRAEAALAHIDVKNVNMSATSGVLRPTDVFSYHSAAISQHLPSSSGMIVSQSAN